MSEVGETDTEPVIAISSDKRGGQRLASSVGSQGREEHRVFQGGARPGPRSLIL